MAASSASLLFPSLPPPFNSRKSYAALIPPPSSNNKKLPTSLTSSSVLKLNLKKKKKKSSTERWRLLAVPDNLLLISEATPLEESQLLDSTSENTGSYIISVLLFVAFVGLSILSIGVIYIAVTDFLQKREKDKFVKEEAAKKKKGGKKAKIKTRARAGPRGFGQKLEDELDDDTE